MEPKDLQTMEDLLTADDSGVAEPDDSKNEPSDKTLDDKEPVNKVDDKKDESVDDKTPVDDKANDNEPVIDEVAQTKAEILELRKKIEELTKPKEPEPDKDKKDLEFKEENFMEGVDLDNLTRDASEFNKLLNKVLLKGINIGEERSKSRTENVIRSIPEIVKTNIATVTSLSEASKKFYDENTDLVPYKKVVALTFEELASKNPDKKYSEILPEVGKEVRKKLNLKDLAINKDKTITDKKPPSLPHRKTQPRQGNKPDLSKIENDLDAMEKALFE
jgi:hypothetical protein